jgi:hypothetical protein
VKRLLATSSAMLVLVLLGLPASGAGAPAGAHAAGPELTASELAADLVAGAQTRQVPPNLDPPLATAGGAVPLIVKNGCHLSRTGLRSKPCVYEDTASGTTVVLFGDSHAAYWFPAVDQISLQQHWRLVDLTKDGCPAAEVEIAAWFRHGGPYPECTRWRASAMAQIAALHPALVIMTEARYLEVPEARPLAGVSAGPGGPWADGVGAIFSFLTHHARHVIFLSDVPTLQRSAPRCLTGHMSGVQLCSTARSAAVRLPRVKAEEFELARRHGVVVADPTSWFCTPTTCPVIVENILLYRDVAHMIPAWSRFIAPLLADALLPVVRGKKVP